MDVNNTDEYAADYLVWADWWYGLTPDEQAAQINLAELRLLGEYEDDE